MFLKKIIIIFISEERIYRSEGRKITQSPDLFLPKKKNSLYQKLNIGNFTKLFGRFLQFLSYPKLTYISI